MSPQSYHLPTADELKNQDAFYQYIQKQPLDIQSLDAIQELLDINHPWSAPLGLSVYKHHLTNNELSTNYYDKFYATATQHQAARFDMRP